MTATEAAATAATTSEDNLHWSVTTILKAGLPKDALMYWAANTTASEAIRLHKTIGVMLEQGQEAEAFKMLKGARYSIVKKAMLRGSELHRAAEGFAYGDQATVADEHKPFVEQYQAWLEHFKPRFIMSEAPVYNRTWRYAGTLDAIVELGGRTYVLDVKTHEKDEDAYSRPPYPDIALQLVAYARAEFVGLQPAMKREQYGRRFYLWDDQQPHEPMPPVDGALALAISPWEYRMVPVRADDAIWKYFLHVREVARFQMNVAPTVLGPTITEVGEPGYADH